MGLVGMRNGDETGWDSKGPRRKAKYIYMGKEYMYGRKEKFTRRSCKIK